MLLVRLLYRCIPFVREHPNSKRSALIGVCCEDKYTAEMLKGAVAYLNKNLNVVLHSKFFVLKYSRK